MANECFAACVARSRRPRFGTLERERERESLFLKKRGDAASQALLEAEQECADAACAAECAEEAPEALSVRNCKLARALYHSACSQREDEGAVALAGLERAAGLFAVAPAMPSANRRSKDEVGVVTSCATLEMAREWRGQCEDALAAALVNVGLAQALLNHTEGSALRPLTRRALLALEEARRYADVAVCKLQPSVGEFTQTATTDVVLARQQATTLSARPYKTHRYIYHVCVWKATRYCFGLFVFCFFWQHSRETWVKSAVSQAERYIRWVSGESDTVYVPLNLATVCS